MQQPVSTVIFDLGAVLIDWNPRYLYRKIFDDEAKVDHFLREICPPEWNKTLDAGRPFAQAVADQSVKFPEFRDEIEAYHTRWLEMIGGPIAGTVTILEELDDKRVPLYALTNWSAESFPLVRHDPTYAFLDRFRHIVVSGEIMLIKPDPEIYRHTLEKTGEKAENCLFIDDSKANCDGAQAMGIQSHHFTSPEKLADDLKRRGLIG